MALTVVFAFASCGNNDTADSSKPDSAVSKTEADEPAEESSAAEEESQADAPADDTGDENTPADSSDGAGAPLDILTGVWSSYGEDEKFAVVGGDLSEENMNTEGPGKYTLADPAIMDSALGFPAASADKIDDAASLVHMLNGNTFTCGAYHVASSGDKDAVVSEIKDNIMSRQWICGFPDKLVIVTEGDCVIAFFGTEDLTNAFRDKLTAAYPSAQIAFEEAIM